MSAEKLGFVWHARDFLTSDKTLDVGPIGWHERDELNLTAAEKKAVGNDIRRTKRIFWGFDSIDPANFCNMKWAFRRAQSKSDVVAKPTMSLGTYPVVTPECREVIEQADLGETDFLRIEVWDVPREKLVFPELYLLHVRNAKQSLDIEGEIERGVIAENEYLPGSFTIKARKTPLLLPGALDGPDIWREGQVSQTLGNTFFISGRLRELLRRAKMDRPWALHKAEVLQTH